MPKAKIPDYDLDALAELGAPEIKLEKLPEIGETRLVRKIRKRRAARLLREQTAADAIGKIPGPGEEVVLIMTGSFHGFDLLTALLDLAGPGVVAEELWVATLGFNRDQTDHLAELIDAGRIRRLTFVVSHMFTEKNADEYEYLAEVLEPRGQTLENTRNHAKLLLLKLSDGRRVVVHGSLNFRRCHSFEQVAICQDAELFGFFRRFIRDAIGGKIQA